jgi:NAD(P)-dependent dehydrogenase (short-subunit alcohol dehydrogenase family)
MMADLTGRVALVTGAGRGLGQGIARVLAQQGASVVAADLNSRNAERVAAEVNALGRRGLGLFVDVTQRESVEEMVAETLARFGQLDILVNNAGIHSAPGWIEAIKGIEGGEDRDQDWDLAYRVNLRGLMYCTRAVSPHLQSRRYGKIINIASIAGRLGRPPFPHYSASKAGVINYTQAMALRLAPDNINVNAVCPGLLWTDMWEGIARRLQAADPNRNQVDAYEVFLESVAQRIPLNREQTPEDIGKMVAFLASEDARNITGQALHVDGGAIML